MNGKTFVNTNVLIYAYDLDEAIKHETAKRGLGDLWDKSAGALSMQVLQDFYVTVTRKIAQPLSRSTARYCRGSL
jgi:predicted nucleic acid-binding protein